MTSAEKFVEEVKKILSSGQKLNSKKIARAIDPKARVDSLGDKLIFYYFKDKSIAGTKFNKNNPALYQVWAQGAPGTGAFLE